MHLYIFSKLHGSEMIYSMKDSVFLPDFVSGEICVILSHIYTEFMSSLVFKVSNQLLFISKSE